MAKNPGMKAPALEQGMPIAQGIEDALLADCMRSESTLAMALGMLEDQDFATEGRKLVFGAIRFIAEEGAQPQKGSVSHYLVDIGKTEHAFGTVLAIDDSWFSLTETTAARYCRILRQNAARRTALWRIEELKSAALESPLDDLAGRLEDLKLEISRSVDRGAQAKRPDEILNEAGGLEEILKGEVAPKIRFPWTEPLGGSARGEMTVLGARPGVGKTAAACQIAFGACLDGHKVHFWEMEMSQVAILLRMAGCALEIRQTDIRNGLTSQEERRKIQAVITRVRESITLMDSKEVTVEAIEKQVDLDHKSNNCPKLVVVDYLQLMEVKGENRNAQLSKITRGLKLITQRYPTSILLLSQLSRDSEKQSNREPRLSDLRDCGSIEQDADNVALLHSPSEVKAGLQDVKWIVAKQRNGEVGYTDLNFNRSYLRFENA